MQATPDRKASSRRGVLRLARFVRRFRKSEDGTAVVEFAILALPFFILVFATIEAFVAFAGEQLLENAVDTMGRQIRTGQITFNAGKPTDLTAAQFRTKFCAEVSLMIKCPPTEDPDNRKLYLDVRQFATFADVPKSIPRVSSSAYGDLDPSSFDYKPGGPGTINIVRAYYRWEVTTDLVRPYITNVRPEGKQPKDYLMVATAAFRNEQYP